MGSIPVRGVELTTTQHKAPYSINVDKLFSAKIPASLACSRFGQGVM